MLRLTPIIALIALGACATDGTAKRDAAFAEKLTDPRVGAAVERICFARGIDGFSEEDDYSVVLRRSVNEEYLVFTQFCPDLKFALSLTIESSSSCLRPRDQIRVYGSPFGPTQADRSAFNRCFINSIYEWDDDAVDPSAEDDSESDDETSDD